MGKERQIIIRIMSGNRFGHDTTLSRRIHRNGPLKKTRKKGSDERGNSSTSPCWEYHFILFPAPIL